MSLPVITFGMDAVIDGRPFVRIRQDGNVTTLLNPHEREACAGRPCVIHNPSLHHMREWTLYWRDDRGIFERICPHGVGHPDPDQFEYWENIRAEHESVHGCDGCCVPPPKYVKTPG
jgi:hypothetical protein